MKALQKAAARVRHVFRLRRFLRETLTPEKASARLREYAERRDQIFLSLVRDGMFAWPQSPYRWLFDHAGLSFSDVEAMVGEYGIEGGLERLYDRGVYITLEEFKGRRPIVRNGLEFSVTASDFDNPITAKDEVNESSGSRGATTAVANDFRGIEQYAMYTSIVAASQGGRERPVALWRDGLTVMLWAKLGLAPQKWWTTRRDHGFGDWLYNASIVLASRLAGRAIPLPKLLKREDAVVLARWLAKMTASGTPARIVCHTSPMVRTCLAAQKHALDISGTLFQTGGEPLTPAKAEIVAASGCTIVDVYATMETTHLAASCAEAEDPNDMHMFTDKVAVIQRQRELAPGVSVGDLIYTSTSPFAPKLLLNVSMGDYGTLEERECGCLFGQMGYTTHLTDLHSYDKLTSEGVSFIGDELYKLLEVDLPSRFGGAPMDYQLVEEEEDGLPRISLLIAPRVGDVDEGAVIQTVLDIIRRQSGNVKPEHLAEDHLLRVQRREPYETWTLKVLPLHVLSLGHPGAEATDSTSPRS